MSKLTLREAFEALLHTVANDGPNRTSYVAAHDSLRTAIDEAEVELAERDWLRQLVGMLRGALEKLILASEGAGDIAMARIHARAAAALRASGESGKEGKSSSYHVDAGDGGERSTRAETKRGQSGD